MNSINNNIVCKFVQTDKEVKATNTRGFSQVLQHYSLIALDVALDATLTDGKTIPQGSKVYLRSDYYQTSKKIPFNLPNIQEPLVIVNLGEIILVEQ